MRIYNKRFCSYIKGFDFCTFYNNYIDISSCIKCNYRFYNKNKNIKSFSQLFLDFGNE